MEVNAVQGISRYKLKNSPQRELEIEKLSDTTKYKYQIKKFVVIPIFTIYNNYRPTFLITHISVFEKLIKTRLTSYMEKYNKISPNQFGFKGNTLTEEATLSLYFYRPYKGFRYFQPWPFIGNVE